MHNLAGIQLFSQHPAVMGELAGGTAVLGSPTFLCRGADGGAVQKEQHAGRPCWPKSSHRAPPAPGLSPGPSIGSCSPTYCLWVGGSELGFLAPLFPLQGLSHPHKRKNLVNKLPGGLTKIQILIQYSLSWGQRFRVSSRLPDCMFSRKSS